MVRPLLMLATALTACTPAPQETAMDSSTRDPSNIAKPPNDAGTGRPVPGDPVASGRADSGPGRAAQGPIPEPISVAEEVSHGQRPDSAEEAVGRRTLSTAYVMVGPDGLLAVELRDGRMLSLRNVVMGAREYCGGLISGGKAGGRYCGGYEEVAAARPGASPTRQ